MGILHSQNYDAGHLGPVQTAILVRGYRIMGGRKNQTVGVIQVHGKLAFSFALRQFVASARPAFWRPEIHETHCGPELRHAQTNFSSAETSMYPVELHTCTEFLCKLCILENYIQFQAPSIMINLLG
jgi:hypothetical protein